MSAVGREPRVVETESRRAYGALVVSWITEITLGATATATITKPVSKSPV